MSDTIEVIAVGVSGCPVDEVAVVVRVPRGVKIRKGDLLVQAPEPSSGPQKWEAGTWYREHDLVTHGGFLWECINAHRNGEPGNCGEILWQCRLPATRFVKVNFGTTGGSNYIAAIRRVTPGGVVVRLRCNGREHTVPPSAIASYPDESGVID